MAQNGLSRLEQGGERLVRRRAGGRRVERAHIAEHGAVKSGFAPRKIQIGGAHVVNGGHGVRLSAVPCARQSFAELFEAASREFDHQIGAVVEMSIGGGGRHAHSFRRLGQGETRRPALGDKRARRVDQRVAQPAVMVAATAFAEKAIFVAHTLTLTPAAPIAREFLELAIIASNIIEMRDVSARTAV